MAVPPGPLPSAEREKTDTVLEARLKTVKSDHEKQLGAVATGRDALRARLSAIQLAASGALGSPESSPI